MWRVSSKCLIWMLPSCACPQCCFAALGGRCESPVSPLPMPEWDMLSRFPVSLSLHCGVCCPRLAAPFPGSLWPWVISGKVFCTFAPTPQQAGSGKGINCYRIVLLGFLRFWVQASRTSCVCHLGMPNARQRQAVWRYTAAALHLALTFCSFVRWLLWWERGDLGRLTATRVSLCSLEKAAGCIFWKGGIEVQLQTDKMPGSCCGTCNTPSFTAAGICSSN